MSAAIDLQDQRLIHMLEFKHYGYERNRDCEGKNPLITCKLPILASLIEIVSLLRLADSWQDTRAVGGTPAKCP